MQQHSWTCYGHSGQSSVKCVACRVWHRHCYSIPPWPDKMKLAAYSDNPGTAWCVCLILLVLFRVPIPVAALSKAWVCGYLLAEIASWNPDICLLWMFVCCQAEIFAMSRSLVLRSLVEFGVSNSVSSRNLFDQEVWAYQGCWATKIKLLK
jgi:hypothetical protein